VCCGKAAKGKRQDAQAARHCMSHWRSSTFIRTEVRDLRCCIPPVKFRLILAAEPRQWTIGGERGN
jgi:hypothetical protein